MSTQHCSYVAPVGAVWRALATGYSPAVDETVELKILDVSARAWHRLDGKFCRADQAEFWSALLKFPRQPNSPFSKCLEPRSSCGKEAGPANQMVWINDSLLEDNLRKWACGGGSLGFDFYCCPV